METFALPPGFLSGNSDPSHRNFDHKGLNALQLCYELAGDRSLPIVVALGGISAHRHVCAHAGDAAAGWWETVAGPGKALDTNRFRLLSFDYLGGNGASSGPRVDGTAFPAVTTADQAHCLALLLDHLGLEAVHAVVGASYGGMVALAFAARYPERLAHLVVLSAAERSTALATAWRTLQRRIVRFGIHHNAIAEALSLSRGLAMTTYRSQAEFSARFAGHPARTATGFRFPVEDYLEARGRQFAAIFDAAAFLCLSESLDMHRVDPGPIVAPATLVSVRSDRLVPPEEMVRLRALLSGPAALHEIDSDFGHDAFLKEGRLLAPILAGALGGAA